MADRIKPPRVAGEPADETELRVGEGADSDDFDAVLAAETAEYEATPLEDFAETAPEGDESWVDPESPVPQARTKPREQNQGVAKPAPQGVPGEAAPLDGAAQAAATEPGAQPAAGAQTQLALDASQPGASAPATLSLDEEIQLTPEHKFSRGSIVKGLMEREQLISERESYLKDLNGYYDALGLLPAQVTQTIKPLFDEMRADPEMETYLNEAIAHYRTVKARRGGTNPTPGAQPTRPGPSLDPAVDARIKQLESVIQAQNAERYSRQVEGEKARVAEKYPALAGAEQVAHIARYCYQMIQNGRANYTFEQAADDVAKTFGIQPKSAATPAPVVHVPALNGGGGASPSVARRATPVKVTAAKDPDSAMDEWLAEYPAGYQPE